MLNQIIIMGRLTRDPELRRTQSGTATSMTVMKNASSGSENTASKMLVIRRQQPVKNALIVTSM